MKLLHREDVLEAGYDLPTIGLCANIGAMEMEELRFGGEWILAEDETLVSDGHEQRYLYMVVSGEVAITKLNDQGKNPTNCNFWVQVLHSAKWLFLAAGLHPLMYSLLGRLFSGGWIMRGF